MVASMKWRPLSDYAAISEDGLYTVAVVIVAGQRQYEAWHLVSAVWQQLGCQLSTAREAQDLCELDSQPRQLGAA